MEYTQLHVTSDLEEAYRLRDDLIADGLDARVFEFDEGLYEVVIY
jgi:hypothetical protein